MRFLDVSNPKHFVPPEAALGLIDALSKWVEKNTAEGKLEQTWSFAGIPGGGGIANVDSHEELDALMIGSPFGPFSEIEVYPLADLGASLQTTKETISAAMAAQGA